MNNALLWIGGLAVALLAALFAAPHMVDWNSYRGVFEEQASRVLGREVRVAGGVNLSLLPAPYVEFERIRIADGAEGQTNEPFFRADKFTMWLSVPPLLRGVLEAKEVTLKRPILRLSVDADGQGNWRTLSMNAADLPFIPAGVALRSVKIAKGVILLQRQGGETLGRVEDVDGELSAEALEGPYKFNGDVTWAGAGREVRVATGRPDPDGGVRFKAAIHAPGGDYTLDGRVSDIGARTRVTGALGAKLSIETDRLAFDSRGKPPMERPAFDLKAVLEGDGAGAALRDIALSFESVGQPQLITGEARAAWGAEPRLDVTLASLWLDLDKIVGADEGAAPLEMARALFAALVRAMPAETRTTTRFSVDQVAFGGEAVSGLAVSLVRSDGPLRLERLRADMPGGVTFDLEGDVSPSETNPSFNGKVALHGTNLGRFLAWGARIGSPGEGHAGGPFALRGQLDVTADGLELTNAVAELAGTPLEGDVKYGVSGRRRLDVRLEGAALDLGQVWPGMTPRALAAWFAPGGAGGEDGKIANARPGDFALRARLGELVLGDRTLRDVDAALALEAGRLSIPALSLKTDGGAAVTLDGDLDGFDGRPKGVLRWTLDAPDAAAAAPFAALAGDSAFLAALFERLAALAPLRLAGSLGLGQRGPESADIMADGVASGGRIGASVRLDGGPGGWTGNPAEAVVTIETSDIDRLSRDLTARPAEAGRPALLPARPGKISIAATGAPSRGLAATAALEAEGLLAAFNGTVTLPSAGGQGGFKGQVEIAARGAGSVLALAGLPAAPGADRFPVDGHLDIERKETTTIFKPAGLTIGGAKVSGELALSSGESGMVRLLGDLDASEASFGSLLSVILSGAAGDEAAPEAAEAAKAGAWPNEAFDFSGLAGLEGEIEIKFQRLDIGGGLALSAAKLAASLSPDKIEIVQLDGSALAGTLGSALTFERAAAGVGLKGAFRLSGAALAALRNQDMDRAASGTANVELSFSGKALSPAALVAALEGAGKIELQSAEISGLSPAGVAAAADGVLLGRASGKGDGLVKALRAGLAQGELKFGSREIPIEIRDGAARVARFAVDSGKGATSAEITVDLATLDVDCEWRIELKSPAEGARRAPLPAVTVGYVGPLSAAASLEPRIGAEALERELTVRRLEQDVGELERLRKDDEERARAEAARQKALEDERARAAEANGAPAGTGAGWTAATTPGTGAPPPADPSGSAPPGPANSGGLTNAEPPRPRKRPPAFNPWDQLDRQFQN